MAIGRRATTCTISRDVVHADDVRAEQDGGGHGRGGAPHALARRHVAERGLEK